MSAMSQQQNAAASGADESTSETGTDSADLSKGKSKGKTQKKGKKGKGKNQAHVAAELPSVPETAATSAGVDVPSWNFSWYGSGDCYMTVSLGKSTSSFPSGSTEKNEVYWADKSLVDLSRNPTWAILDLGCTRAMGSRAAVTAFCKAATKAGLKYTLEKSNATFGFANSQQSQCREIGRAHV